MMMPSVSGMPPESHPEFAVVQADSSDDARAVVRGIWRAGDMMRYELEEETRLYQEGELAERRQTSTTVHIDVAAKRPGEEYVLLWQILDSNAPLFGDDVLDEYMYGVLSDGIVVHTDAYGAFSHASNIGELHKLFSDAVAELDRQGHWENEQKSQLREQLSNYEENTSLFEELLLRDMKFIFGLHGVELHLLQPYTYETVQDNPWGQPIASEGRINVQDYDEETRLLYVVNEVQDLYAAENRENPPFTLTERQEHAIHARTGWPHKVLLLDYMKRDDFERRRRLSVEKIDF